MFFEGKDMEQFYNLSKSQNLAALCWYYLRKQDVAIDPQLQEKFRQEYAKALYVRTLQNKAYESLVTLFNNNAIRFLPLKGLVIRNFYEVPELRFSCDLDILIHSRDFQKARTALEADGWSTDGVLNFHDMHFYKNRIHLELHYNICENMPNIDKVLADVWKNVSVKEKYELKLNDTFLLYHQIAHGYYHYMHGGCGIKSVIDIKILREKLLYDQKQLESYLDQSGIEDFYNEMVSLIGYWFNQAEPNEKDIEMEKFIIDGGAYGSNINVIEDKHKLYTYWQKVILPSNVMYAYYPKLDAHHALLPAFHVWRWGRAIYHRMSGTTAK